jgi:hypothetical protein
MVEKETSQGFGVREEFDNEMRVTAASVVEIE